MPRASPRPLLLAVLLLAPAAALAGPAASAGDANGDGVAVIAVVDSGVNPYHEDFRDTSRTAHPSTYLPGYPADALALALALDAPTLAAALDADRATFRSMPARTLHWIPGTTIVGAFVDTGAASNGAANALPLFDDDGHGTAAASVAAGRVHGACRACVLVVVEGFDGLEWATRQPWIDVVSNSWGTTANVGAPVRSWGFENDWTMRGAERGQTILFATGNGVENAFLTPEQTWLSNTNGPDWVVNVGAYSGTASEPRPIAGQGKPLDVLGPGVDVPAAAADSLDGEIGFSGTSAATPFVAGAMAETLARARAEVGDAGVGQRRTAHGWRVAIGAPVGDGALADGLLSRDELWDRFFRVASPTRAATVGVYPATTPHLGGTGGDALAEGYGAVTRATAGRAADALTDRAPAPPRGDVEGWMDLDGWTRDILWGAWDRNGDGLRDRSVTPPLVLP